MSDQSIADLDAQIAAFDAAVRHIKFNRRAMLAGRASGPVRKHSPQALDLRARYEADGGGYGRVRQLAREIGLSERQAHRILRDLKPGGSASSVKACGAGSANGSETRSAIMSAPATPIPPLTPPTPEPTARVKAGDSSSMARKRHSGKQDLAGSGANPTQTTQLELFPSAERPGSAKAS
jgi:hypothetical protein